MTRGKKILKLIRQICSVLLVALLISPETKQLLITAVTCTWGVSALLTNRVAFVKAINTKIVWINLCYPLIITSYCILGNSLFILHSFYLPILWLFAMYYYYLKEDVEIKLTVYVSLFYILLIAMVTICELKSEPQLSRLLASSNPVIESNYIPTLTAGYAHIYSSVILSMAFTAVIFTLQKNNIFTFFIFLVEIFTCLLIFKAGYTMALLLAIFFTALIIFYKCYPKRIRFVVVLGLIILLPFLFWGVGKCLLWGSQFINNSYTEKRLIELANLLHGNGIKENGSVMGRISLYLQSIKTFINHPLLGVGNSNLYRMILYGGHSTFLDKLACFGIIGGGAYILTFIYNMCHVYRTLRPEWKKNYLYICIVYIIISTINVTDITSISVVLFVLIPYIFIIASFKKGSV